MRGRASWVLVAVGSWLAPGVAWAQCTKDTDCKGDRICEEGKCTSPGSAAPPVAATEAPATPAAALAPAGAEGGSAAGGSSAPTPPPPAAAAEAAPVAATEPLGADEPATRRRSKAAMATGIVLVSAAPIALLGALAAKNAQEQCDEELQNQYPGRILPSSERFRAERCDDYSVPLYVLGIGAAVFGAVGLPLIIYGAPRVPNEKAPQVSVVPWGNAQSGGVRVRFAL